MARRLAPAHALGTMSVLRPEAWAVSPAIGLLARDAPGFVPNPLRCGVRSAAAPWALDRAHGLARELFYERRVGGGGAAAAPVAPTRSRSAAAAWVDPPLLGHLVGLALAPGPPPDDAALDRALRARGIASNRARGAPTGVSLARFRRLVRLLAPRDDDAGACGGATTIAPTPALAVALRFLWQTASSKACLLAFLRALDEHVPVLARAAVGKGLPKKCLTTPSHCPRR